MEGFSRIHLKAVHNMTVQEYLDRYPMDIKHVKGSLGEQVNTPTPNSSNKLSDKDVQYLQYKKDKYPH